MNRTTIRLPAKPSLPGWQLHRYWFKPCLFMLGPRWSKKGIRFFGLWLPSQNMRLRSWTCTRLQTKQPTVHSWMQMCNSMSLILKQWFAWKTLRNSLRPQFFWSLIGFHLYNTSKSRLSGKGPRVLRVETPLLANGIELWLLTKPPVDVYCLMTSGCVLVVAIGAMNPRLLSNHFWGVLMIMLPVNESL